MVKSKKLGRDDFFDREEKEGK